MVAGGGSLSPLLLLTFLVGMVSGRKVKLGQPQADTPNNVKARAQRPLAPSGGTPSKRAAASAAGIAAGAAGASRRSSRPGLGERGKLMRAAAGGADQEMSEEEEEDGQEWEDDEEDDVDMWAAAPSRGRGGKHAARGRHGAPASTVAGTPTGKSRAGGRQAAPVSTGARTSPGNSRGAAMEVDGHGSGSEDGSAFTDEDLDDEELEEDDDHDEPGVGGSGETQRGGRFRGRGDTRTTAAAAGGAIDTYDFVGAVPPGSATSGLASRVVDKLMMRTFGMSKSDGTHAKLLRRGLTGGIASLVMVLPFPDTYSFIIVQDKSSSEFFDHAQQLQEKLDHAQRLQGLPLDAHRFFRKLDFFDRPCSSLPPFLTPFLSPAGARVPALPLSHPH
ncbi:hypothetical protein T484DRAFT_1755537 [Baffinella frigidus]|nr:hypothetical protein T484DRAFT_1755537 [Cryptophyta sp. CCMP2293]